MKIVIIGGGAAGYFAAIACAETHPKASVTLLEATRSPLTKVSISGGGRCNVTHACFEPSRLVQNYPRGGRALRGAFSRFQPQDTLDWFAARGVPLKTEADGRMFPTTDNSATIVHCLETTATQAGVKIWTEAPATQVDRTPTGFAIHLKSRDTAVSLGASLTSRKTSEPLQAEPLQADRLLLATGSAPRGHQLAQSLGHSIIPPVPSLFTFNILDPALRDLAGVSMPDVALKLRAGTETLEQQGPLLLTHWGLSGPAVLKLSAWGARALHGCGYRAQLSVNWLPQLASEPLRSLLTQARDEAPRRQLNNHRPVPLPSRLWDYLLGLAGVEGDRRWGELSNKALHQLHATLSQTPYQIQGKGVFKDEFVTCGGVNLKEVDFKTLESRCCPGLYFAGEILDIDGVTGGFNFQNAWTTGWLAGQAIGA